ncbi:hypothetical protein G7Z17_g5678 [Cylindrodendrum hubeiense]|uniref:NAD(P)-binding protein n=1 Tax=Cylindrodendrum hubeiense TaxID=595255 RepID=A0A9P5HAG5_9HYPO|nr:hypothetical protein G7Z17_g5678 [Cylindrodendrum hubeiense]
MATTWLITGTTSGIGEALVRDVLARGDNVIASGRKVEERLGPRIAKSECLAFLELDISASQQAIDTQVKKAWDIFGSIDVLVNNAGCTGFRSAEEADEPLWANAHVTRHLPILSRSGPRLRRLYLVEFGLGPLPFMSHYGASKAALSAYVEALHKEGMPLGIRCVAIECGGIPTSLGQPREEGKETFAQPTIAGYLPLFGELMDCFVKSASDMMPGDVVKVARSIVDVVSRTGVAAGRPWAIRVPLGSDGWGYAAQKCEEHLQVLKDWKEVSVNTDRDGVTAAATELTHKFTTIISSE